MITISNDKEGSAAAGLKQLQASVDAARPAHDAAAFLAAIVESSDDAIVSKTLEGNITTWNRGAERLFGYNSSETIGRPITILIPPDRLDEEPTIIARIQRGERVDHFETKRRRKDGTLVDISLTISPIRNQQGEIVGASKIARDISEQKNAAVHRELLLREMHHRVKNLFAVTASIITLCAKTADTPAELAAEMKSRLLALARTHEMTLPSFDEGDFGLRENPTSLMPLLSIILAPFDDPAIERWRMTGDDVAIKANDAMNFALLFHELAINAAKYGALGVAGGMLTITIAAHADGFELLWSETNPTEQRYENSGETGFGSRLEQAVVKALKAKLSREWRPEGLSVRLEFRDAELVQQRSPIP